LLFLKAFSYFNGIDNANKYLFFKMFIVMLHIVQVKNKKSRWHSECLGKLHYGNSE